MTTGRINQVAASGLRLCTSPPQLGRAHESRPLIHALEGGGRGLTRSAETARHPPPHLSRVSTSHSPRTDLACARAGNLFPGQHRPCFSLHLLGLLYSPARYSSLHFCLAWPQGPTPNQRHGVCLRARARTCAGVSGRVLRDSLGVSFSFLQSNLSPHIYHNTLNITSCATQRKTKKCSR